MPALRVQMPKVGTSEIFEINFENAVHRLIEYREYSSHDTFQDLLSLSTFDEPSISCWILLKMIQTSLEKMINCGIKANVPEAEPETAPESAAAPEKQVPLATISEKRRRLHEEHKTVSQESTLPRTGWEKQFNLQFQKNTNGDLNY